MPKRVSLFLVLAFLFLTVFSAFPARAASTSESASSFVPGSVSSDGFWGLCYAENGVSDTAELFPTGDGSVLCLLRDGIWEGEGPFRTTRLYVLSSPDDPDRRLSMLTAIFPRYAPEDGGDEVVFRMDLSEFSLDADRFAVLRFGVCFEEAEGEFPLSLTLSTDEGRLEAALTVSTADTPVRNGGIVKSETGWSVVTADLSGTSGTVGTLEVRLGVDRENLPARVYLTGPSFEVGSTEARGRAQP